MGSEDYPQYKECWSYITLDKLRWLPPEFGGTNTSARSIEVAVVFHVVLVLSKWDSKTLKSDLLKASAVQKCHSLILQETTCMHVFTLAKLKRNMFSIARLGAFEGGNSCLCSNVPSIKVQDWPGRRKHSATSASQRSSLTILDIEQQLLSYKSYSMIFLVVKIFRSFPLLIFFVIYP